MNEARPTKYVLHGGAAQHPNKENDLFFSEILKDTPAIVRVLLVFFASEGEKDAANFSKDTAQFNRVRGNKQLDFEVANQAEFIQQIDAADVVYLGGGTTVKLLAELKKFPDLKGPLSGKIVAGESAGANAVCAYCYSKSGGGIIKGFGLVPIKIIPHFNGEHLQEMMEVSKELETVTLAEYKFKIFTV